MTRASAKPLVRIVLGGTERMGLTEMVLEVTDLEARLRPLRTRRGGPQEVVVPWGALYLRAIQARVESERRTKQRKGGRR